MIIHNLEQNSLEWLKMRSSIPTASNASRLITSKGKPSTAVESYAIELAGNLYAGKDLNSWEGSQYTDRGHEIEPNARAAYELDNNMDVEEVGFITDDKQIYGCSPDGLVGSEGMVEFKCLPKHHIKALLYYDKHGKAPTEYYAQCQMQLFVAERSWNDLMFYHDSLPSLTIRVIRNGEFIKIMDEQILTVLLERDRIYEILQGM